MKKPLISRNVAYAVCFLQTIGLVADMVRVPYHVGDIVMLSAAVVFLFGLRAGRKGKVPEQVPTESDSNKRKRIVLLVVSSAAASVAAPFWLPLTGLALPFPYLIAVSVITFFVCVGAIWIGAKKMA